MARKSTVGQNTKRRVQEELEERKGQLRDTYDQIKMKAHEYGDEFDERIMRKPRESVLVAFGTGALVGAALIAVLMGRKR